MEHETIIKQNDFYRIVKDGILGYFLDGKNSLDRWVIIRSLEENQIDEVWDRADRFAKYFASEKAQNE